jgi:phage repressor protein C with HTH and peptisase S24 domain
MLSHGRIWAAIDQLAARHGLSPSGLARRAGLDATTFNPSKRIAAGGRKRWPSTESIAKILEATGERLGQFLALVEERRSDARRGLPLLGSARAGAKGFFEESGFPVGYGWDEIDFPGLTAETAYALRVDGDSMLPLYREGDTLIVSPTATIRPGDRVVVRTREGEVMAKVLGRRTQRTIELRSLNPEHPDRTFRPAEIEWLARIMWASQ